MANQSGDHNVPGRIQRSIQNTSLKYTMLADSNLKIFQTGIHQNFVFSLLSAPPIPLSLYSPLPTLSLSLCYHFQRPLPVTQ